MLKRLVVLAIVPVAGLMFSPLARAQGRQPGAVYDFDKKGEKSAPAPVHDISGTWEPAEGPGGGIAGKGALAMLSCKPDDAKWPLADRGRAAPRGWAENPNPPLTDTGYATPDCLKPDVEPPYTPLGLETLKTHKPTEGYRMVPSGLTNDPSPLLGCEPGGFPRIVLHNFRTSEIIQTPDKVVILYMFNKKWRTIWTDGRALPKDPTNPSWDAVTPPEPRYWGYSVGKWVDDYTFVAESTGFDYDKTWLDNAGLPHSDSLIVEETYHRRDREHLEISIKVTDPKFYTKPWMALDKLPVRLQAAGFDIRENECSPSDSRKYQELVGAGGLSDDK